MAPGSIVYQVENCRDLEKRETLLQREDSER